MPTPAAGEVLVRVRAAAANPLDYHYIKGFWATRLLTGVLRPKRGRAGVDLSGVVEAIGPGVSGLKPGDEVFGCARGAFAEYVCAPEAKLALKGSAMSFEEAAAIPVAGLTALQVLRDKGNLSPGQSVLVNGAAGGVGSYAVQIAKSMGCEVSAVCGTRNVELMQQLGATEVFDYIRQDFTKARKQYDLVLDAIGNHPVSKLCGVLKPSGILLNIGVRPGGPVLGPIPRLLKLLWASRFGSRKVVFMIANLNTPDLGILRDMISQGKIKSVIDSVYRFSDTPEALTYLREGHVSGKVVVSI